MIVRNVFLPIQFSSNVVRVIFHRYILDRAVRQMNNGVSLKNIIEIPYEMYTKSVFWDTRIKIVFLLAKANSELQSDE